jgi:hypothetical protein
MALTIEDMFNPNGKASMLSRINALTPNSKPLWGKMNVGQMLAHCNVAYEIVHEPGKHSAPGFVGKFFARVFAKETVVGDKPYPQNGPTAPMFVIKDSKDFDKEKARLVAYINKTFQQGAAHYEGLENMTFGKLSAKQWNTLFSKHLDHHLRQFGA